jgi:hypothetical protein
MNAFIEFTLCDELDSGMDWTCVDYDNYLLDNFGLKIIQSDAIAYKVVDVDKFTSFMLQYPEYIIRIEEANE